MSESGDVVASSSSSGEHGDEGGKQICSEYCERELRQCFCLGPEGDVSYHMSSASFSPTQAPSTILSTYFPHTEVTTVREEDEEEAVGVEAKRLGYVLHGRLGPNVYLVKATDNSRLSPNYRSDGIMKLSESEAELKLLQSPDAAQHCPTLFIASTSSELGPRILILEMCHGTLEEVTRGKHGSALAIEWVQKMVGELAAALDFLHSQQFAHHRVRLEHVLLVGGGRVKLCGLSNLLPASPPQLLPLPTPPRPDDLLYWAPEMILLPSTSKHKSPKKSAIGVQSPQSHTSHSSVSGLKRHSYSPVGADLYALGIIAYFLLTGTFPHPLTPDPREARQFKYGLRNLWKGVAWVVPEEAQKLTGLLLSPLPNYRPSASRVRFHDWLQNPPAPQAILGLHRCGRTPPGKRRQPS